MVQHSVLFFILFCKKGNIIRGPGGFSGDTFKSSLAEIMAECFMNQKATFMSTFPASKTESIWASVPWPSELWVHRNRSACRSFEAFMPATEIRTYNGPSLRRSEAGLS